MIARTICCVSLAALMLLADASRASAADILFMINPAVSPSADAGIAARLEAQGHNVTEYDVAQFDPQAQIDAANAHDMVMISESIASVAVLNGFDFNLLDYAKPVVCFEAFIFENARWTGTLQNFDFGVTGRPNEQEANHPALVPLNDKLRIVNAGHPLAAGLANGPTVVYTQPYTFNIALVGPGATVIATADSDVDPVPVHFVYEPGSALYDDTITPGMRIGLFLGQYGNNSPADPPGPPQFSFIGPNGLALIDAAVRYAVGTPLTADFNDSGAVNAADFAKWKTDFGATAGSDADGDGDSDGADFLAWQREFGLPQTTAAAIPEPTSLTSVATAMIIAAACRRRRFAR